MSIHIPTLLLAIVMGFALLGLALVMAQRNTTPGPELRLWTAGVWAFLIGFTFFGLRPWIVEWLSILVGNAMIALGATFIGDALHHFLLDRPMPRWIWALWAVSTVGLLEMMSWPLVHRTGVMSFVLAALLFPSVVLAALLFPSVALIVRRGWRDGAPVAVALLDIDHFKLVNDRFGHRADGAVLKAFAQTVRARLRASDVLGRVGGEEFLMLLPAAAQPACT